MSISFLDEKEAIAAVALVMIGADGIGTLGERTTLFKPAPWHGGVFPPSTRRP